MKKLTTAIVAIALIGTPAFAADMARKMPVALATVPSQQAALGDIRRDPPRLIFARSDCRKVGIAVPFV